jgi:alcohol dehydrogenase
MSQDARAMVFDGPGRPLRPERFPLPDLGPGEVLVRVVACTLCGSDLHTYQGRRATDCPTILGHEIVGVVEALSSEDLAADLQGEPLRVGDRVVWSLTVGCGACFFCARGLPHKCDRLVKYGHERIRPAHALSGGLATHCHLRRGTAVLRVPAGVPDLVACPAGCATATVAAALRPAGGLAGAVVLVQGAGMLGLTAAALAASRAAAAVVVCDPDPGRVQLARRFGATHAVLVEEGGGAVRAVVARLTDGRGADVALELSGAPAAVEAGLGLLRIGGVFVWVGAVFPTRPVAVTPETVVRRHLTIHGVHNYHPRDLVVALEFLGRHHHNYPFAELVSRRFRLEEAGAAFRLAGERQAVRVAVIL